MLTKKTFSNNPVINKKGYNNNNLQNVIDNMGHNDQTHQDVSSMLNQGASIDGVSSSLDLSLGEVKAIKERAIKNGDVKNQWDNA